jgi:hypothetical protein
LIKEERTDGPKSITTNRTFHPDGRSLLVPLLTPKESSSRNSVLRPNSQTQPSENASEFNSRRTVRRSPLMSHTTEVFCTLMKTTRLWSLDSVDPDMPSEIFQESDFWSLELRESPCLPSSRVRLKLSDD